MFPHFLHMRSSVPGVPLVVSGGPRPQSYLFSELVLLSEKGAEMAKPGWFIILLMFNMVLQNTYCAVL